ncbi:MAG: glutaredoxin family protein [Rhodocyclaceae bacterium]|uniref:glutaredoxin family protein n=1 Tax=Sulfuricystis thermophila TaxID=2496847 RepID=UPI001559B94E|nr:glutaredoxin family protein [Sulfuricystis thermophila]MDI6749325.1 glutaredoxin family protein [Rhodocyclaceae bacterium]
MACWRSSTRRPSSRCSSSAATARPSSPSRGLRISKPILTLYGRPGCHLCDDMLAVLEDLRGEFGFEIEVCDVDTDPGWRERFGSRIPVLMLGETEICHFFLDPAALRAKLSR